MKNLRLFLSVLLMSISTSVFAQYRYCSSYEDFCANKWTKLDTVYCESRSKAKQTWLGGNDFKLTTGDEATDKILKKEAFIVMDDDTLYLNTRSLRYEKTQFENGYTKAIRVGKNELMFVNMKIGKEAQTRMIASMVMGTVASAINANSMMKQQVCYIISEGADTKGRIPIQLIDDDMVEKKISNNSDLLKEYYSEKDNDKRIRATHVIPILEKAGKIAAGKGSILLQALGEQK